MLWVWERDWMSTQNIRHSWLKGQYTEKKDCWSKKKKKKVPESCESSETEGRDVRMQCDKDVGGSADTTNFTHTKHCVVKSCRPRHFSPFVLTSAHTFWLWTTSLLAHTSNLQICPVGCNLLPHYTTDRNATCWHWKKRFWKSVFSTG